MARKDKHLVDIITRHQVYLERLKSFYVRDLGVALRKLTRAIVDVLAGLDVENVNELTRRQLSKLLEDLRVKQLDVMNEGIDRLLPELEKLAGYEAVFEARALQQIVHKLELVVPNAQEAFREAMAHPLTATGELLEPFIRGWANSEVTAVSNLVRKGFADGWTNQQLQTAIRGTKAQGYEDGLVAKIGRNASAVVRTSTQHVASSARMEVWARNADVVDGYDWLSTLDSKTTAICRTLDGQFFEIGQGPRPPAHVNCRSTTVAHLNDNLDFLDEGATRSSANGYVSADLTYYDWLKQQPAAFQDSAIGPTRGTLLRDGGLSAEKFAQLNLGRNFEPLTLDEMRKLEPKAFERAGL